MSDSVKVALVGCGFFARNHLFSWKDLAAEGADLVAVCDIDAAKAEAAAKEFNVPRWYTDFDAMVEAEQIDLLDIATRMDTHRMLVEKAIGRGIATIVQKPFAPTWEDAVAMTAAAEKAGVFLAVHENFRFQTPLIRVAETLRTGVIGTGENETPTPPGRYYFTELLQPPDPDGDYGVYAFGLSGFSESLETFAGGPGQLAVHGTNDESALGQQVSHGCVRVSNEDITWMAENLPVGTPVEISG